MASQLKTPMLNIDYHSLSTSASSWKEWLLLTAIEVPGKNINVMIDIVFMDELSFWDSSAVLAEL